MCHRVEGIRTSRQATSRAVHHHDLDVQVRGRAPGHLWETGAEPDHQVVIRARIVGAHRVVGRQDRGLIPVHTDGDIVGVTVVDKPDLIPITRLETGLELRDRDADLVIVPAVRWVELVGDLLSGRHGGNLP